MMQHQKRRFMEKIDYITSCGWMDGPGGRERAGLPGNRGPQMVVTDLAPACPATAAPRWWSPTWAS